MTTIVKILVLSLVISVLIKYVLPIGLDLDQLSRIDRDRVAILLLTLIPALFLGSLWGFKPK